MGIKNIWNPPDTETNDDSETSAPELPLKLDGGLIKSFPIGEIGWNGLVKQNIKMILLTRPGERIMLTNFGVGLSRYLFYTPTPALYSRIKAVAMEQLNLYSFPISIQKMDVGHEEQILYFRMNYIVDLTKTKDKIELTFDLNDFLSGKLGAR